MKVFLAVLFFIAVMPKIVFAYLDPGSGSYLLQLILGTLLGGAFFFRNFFGKAKNKIVTLLKKIFNK